MANQQITELPQAGALVGTEAVPVVQNGVTVQTTTGAISGAGALNYPFLTVGQTSGLSQSRYLSTNSGLSLTDNGAQGTLQVNLIGAAMSLNSSGNGIQVKTALNTVTEREIKVGTGLGVADGDGVLGNPTVSLGTFLQQLVSQSGTGFLVLQSGSPSKVEIEGATNQISISNGNGAANPIISLSANPVIPGTGSVTVPNGTSVQRTGSFGAFRYNTSLQQFEGFTSTGWNQFSLTGGVTSFSAGTTGFSPSTDTTGAVTLSGILNPASGGTGVNNGSYTTTLTGNVSTTGALTTGGALTTAGAFTTSGAYALTLTATGVTNVTLPNSGTLATLSNTETFTNKSISGASNTLTDIGNASLVNSSLTYNGVSVALGASGTITAVNPFDLTIGTGLSGTSYDGASAKTIAIANTGVTAGTYGTDARSMTLVVNAQGQITSLYDQPIAISYTQVSGLGTAANLNAGVANGVATLDGSGTIPLSQIPASLQGALNYQGTWDASTNTPTLTSSVGSKGFYYVVSVAGSTNLNGTTDWKIGDWAVFNGSIWQKIDNTDLVTSVNGYTGTVTLGYADVGAPSVSGANATGTWGIGISGNAATVTNGVYTTGSYADPTWITSLATSKLSGTVAVANGGTSFASYTVGDMLWASGATTLAKLGIGTNTYIMTSSGSAPQWSNPTGVTVGAATNLAGGTAGAVPYNTGAGATSFLSLGTSGYVLTAGATAPQYVAQSTLSVGSAASATNASNVVITENSANATNYLTFVSATTGNLPQLVNSSITCNPSTGKLTGGIAGGAF